MVLSNDYVKSNFNKIKEHSYNYLFLNVESLNNQTATLERTLEVLVLINDVDRINKLSRGLNSRLKLDYNILYDIIKAIYTNEPLTDPQLLEYIKLKTYLTDIYDSMYSFTEIECSLGISIEYFMFGFSFEDQEKLCRENLMKLEEEFNDAFYENYKGLNPAMILKKSKEAILKYKNLEPIESREKRKSSVIENERKEQNQELAEQLFKLQNQENIISNILDSYNVVFNFMYTRLDDQNKRKVDVMMKNIKGLKN